MHGSNTNESQSGDLRAEETPKRSLLHILPHGAYTSVCACSA